MPASDSRGDAAKTSASRKRPESTTARALKILCDSLADARGKLPTNEAIAEAITQATGEPITPNYLSLLRTGRRAKNPSQKVLEALSAYFGVSSHVFGIRDEDEQRLEIEAEQAANRAGDPRLSGPAFARLSPASQDFVRKTVRALLATEGQPPQT